MIFDDQLPFEWCLVCLEKVHEIHRRLLWSFFAGSLKKCWSENWKKKFPAVVKGLIRNDLWKYVESIPCTKALKHVKTVLYMDGEGHSITKEAYDLNLGQDLNAYCEIGLYVMPANLSYIGDLNSGRAAWLLPMHLKGVICYHKSIF